MTTDNRTPPENFTPLAKEFTKSLFDRLGSPLKKDVQSNEEQRTSEAIMTDHVGRSELDAKLETIEARMDGRLARIEDRFNSIDKHFESIGHQFLEVRATLEEQKNTAWKAAAATIGIMIATIIAVAALGFSAFDSGRDTEKIASEAKAEISSSVAEIKQMVQEMKQQQEEVKP